MNLHSTPPEDAAVTHWLNHSLVLASDHRVSSPEKVGPLLERRKHALAELGAHHVLVYESTTEPGRVLVMFAIHTREPLLKLLRSRTLFEWFDAVGVEDIPAVFAGEEIERLEVTTGRQGNTPEVMVSVLTPVEDLATLRAHVRRSRADLRAAGIRKVLMFSAFDNPLEVMMLLQIVDEAHAEHWLTYSELAAEWLGKAGQGAYPTVFAGRFRSIVRIADDR
jgi:hypothetical protein